MWEIISLSRITKMDLAMGFTIATAYLQTYQQSLWDKPILEEAQTLTATLQTSGLDTLKWSTKKLV